MKYIKYPLLLIIAIGFLFIFAETNESYITKDIDNHDDNMFAMYVENESGTYDTYDSNDFPSFDFYTLNKTLSSCNNANGIKIDVTMNYTEEGFLLEGIDEEIKCTLYFDKK